jgi:hypothetical protein
MLPSKLPVTSKRSSLPNAALTTRPAWRTYCRARDRGSVDQTISEPSSLPETSVPPPG